MPSGSCQRWQPHQRQDAKGIEESPQDDAYGWCAVTSLGTGYLDHVTRTGKHLPHCFHGRGVHTCLFRHFNDIGRILAREGLCPERSQGEPDTRHHAKRTRAARRKPWCCIMQFVGLCRWSPSNLTSSFYGRKIRAGQPFRFYASPTRIRTAPRFWHARAHKKQVVTPTATGAPPRTKARGWSRGVFQPQHFPSSAPSSGGWPRG